MHYVASPVNQPSERIRALTSQRVVLADTGIHYTVTTPLRWPARLLLQEKEHFGVWQHNLSMGGHEIKQLTNKHGTGECLSSVGELGSCRSDGEHWETIPSFLKSITVSLLSETSRLFDVQDSRVVAKDNRRHQNGTSSLITSFISSFYLTWSN